MLPAAMLAVVVEARGVSKARAELQSVNAELLKTDSLTKRAGTSIATFGSRAEKAGKMLTKYVAAPLLAIGAASGVMAAKFERSMNLIHTDAGGSAKEVAYLSKEVLNLAKSSEFGPQKLADSLFYIESAGIRGKKAIQDLDSIQRAAMAGNAELETTVFGTVGAYNALGAEGKNVEKILATMNAVVGHGHLRMEELVKAMSTGFMGVGKKFGLTFEGMGSALAFFTRMSEPAQQAATRMRQTIVHLGTESTEKAGAAMESIGMNFAHMGNEIEKTHSILPVLEELHEHLEGVSKAQERQILVEAFGGGRYGTQIQEALNNLKLFKRTEEEIGNKNSVPRLKKNELDQEKTYAVQIKMLWSGIEAEMIKLGNTILPIILPIMKSIVEWLVKASEWFQALSGNTKHWIIVIGLVVIAFAGLLRVVGGFIKSLGEIIQWFGKTEAANTELIASNQAVADSYGEIEASAASALEARKGMETSYGSFAGGRAADKAGLPTEEDLAPSTRMKASSMLSSGKSMAGSLASGLTSGIPGMFAMYGVGNIITSVVNGDMQDAGAEGAGALIGGIAAVATGNPELAGVGVGIGSLIGEKISEMFSKSDPLSELEKQAKQSAKQVSDALGNMRSSFKELKEAEGSVKEAHDEVHSAAKNLRTAEEKLANAREEGKGAHAIISDEDQVYNAFRRNTRAIKDQEKALRFQQFAEKNKNASVGEVVHTSKIGMRQSERRISHIEAQEANGPITPEEIKASGSALRAYNHDVKAYNEAIKVARGVNKNWAVSLENMSGLQNRYGKEGHALAVAIHNQKEEVEKLKAAIAVPDSSPIFGKQLDQAEYKLKKMEGHFGELKDSLIANMTVGEKESLLAVDRLSEGAGQKFKDMGGTVGIIFKGLETGMQDFDPKLNLKTAHSEVHKMGTNVNETSTKVTELNVNLHQKFQPGLEGVLKNTGQKTEEWAEQTTGGFGEVIGKASSIVKAWGGTPPSVHSAEKGKEVVKKARGGHLPGSQTGDRIPALLEDGEYVVNREAVKKIGVHNLNAINFGMAPRFAEGGAVQKAAAEAESLIGTPYVWGGGHGGWGESAGLDCSGAVSKVLHAAGLLNTPETSGPLESWGLPGPGPITVHANSDHAWMSIMGKPWGTSVDDSSKGLNWYPKPPASYSAGFVTRHADVAAAEIAGGAQQVTAPVMEGVGAAQGNALMNGVAKATNEWITKNEPGEFGGGNIGEFTGTGDVAKEMGETLMGNGLNRIGAAGIMGNAWQESSWNPASVGSGGGGLLGFTAGEISWSALQNAASAAGKNPESAAYQMKFALEHISGSILHGLNIQKTPDTAAQYFMEEWEKPLVETENLARREEGARKAYALGYAKGGPAKRINEIGGMLHKGTHEVAKGKALEGFAGIKQGVRALGKVEGLSDKQIEALIKGTEASAQYSEYASNAGAANSLEEQKPNEALERAQYQQEELEYQLGKLQGAPAPNTEQIASVKGQLKEVKGTVNSLTREEELWSAKTVFGKFQGKDEGFWLKSELEAMASQRNSLITSGRSIKGPQEAINVQVKKFKHMLHLAEAHQREYEKKIKDIEKVEKEIKQEEKEAIKILNAQKQEVEGAEHAGQHKLEKEKNELENQLSKLEGAKNPNQGAIKGVKAQISAVSGSLHDTESSGHQGVKGIEEKIHEVESTDAKKLRTEHKHLHAAEKALHGFEGQVTSYTEELIPAVEEKRTTIDETAAGLITGYSPTGGKWKNKSWEGMTELQGQIENMKTQAQLPEFPNGKWGGNILAVQQGLEAYATVNKPPLHGLGLHFEAPEEEETIEESSTAKELKELEKEMALINMHREEIRGSNLSVMSGMASVKEVVGISVPYAGAFAKGGMVAAEVGERGREIAVMPQGTQMVNHYDAMDAIGGKTNLNFEHIEFHEAEQKVKGKLNGMPFEQEVESVNRNTTRRATWGKTPGGSRDR